jgi:hypothetical protein
MEGKMEGKIIDCMESPGRMEVLYHEDSIEFSKAFPSVFDKNPESTILQVWNERLNYQKSILKNDTESAWNWKSVLFIAVLIAAAGTLFKLPQLTPSYYLDWMYPRNFALVFLIPILIYFLQKQRSTTFIVLVSIAAIACLFYMNLLPGIGIDKFDIDYTYRSFSDAITSSTIHISLLIWLITGIGFCGLDWKKSSSRMGFIRFNGEFIIFTAIILLGEGILYIISAFLLGFQNGYSDIQSFYDNNILIYLLVAAPIFATFLIDHVITKRQNIAPAVARIFTPLFMVSLIAYLIIIAATRQNPFTDRDYLLLINILLIVVLGLLIFTIAEHDPDTRVGINDYLTMGLALVTIILNGTILVTFIFRSTGDTYGLTPNRITILGINLLVFIHILGIFFHYLRFVWSKGTFEKLERWVTGYLPCYAIWSIAIAILLPAFFWYKK